MNDSALEKPRNYKKHYVSPLLISYLIFFISIYALVHFIQKSSKTEKDLISTRAALENITGKYNLLYFNTQNNKLNEQKADPELESLGPECSYDAEKVIMTKDQEFILSRVSGTYQICEKRKGTDRYNMIEIIESRMQSENFLVVTLYGDKMFIADLEVGTLNLVTGQYFPDAKDYMKEGSINMYFFGPNEDDYTYLSPMKDKLIFGAAPCHDCDTTVYSYVLNFKTNKITKIGNAHKGIKWLNNNTVAWEDFITREPTEEECNAQQTSDTWIPCFPVVYESVGMKTKTIE